MSITGGEAEFKRIYQISPITLTGGIASKIPGGMLPFMNITQALNFRGFLNAGDELTLDDFFANYYPLPGSSMIDNQIGKYPFANQVVAGNAIIKQPLTVSLLMVCPSKGRGSLGSRLAVMTSIQSTLDQHNTRGGTYTIATPSFYWTNTVMVGMHDVSGGETNQVQVSWKLDFEKPLISLQDAENAQNAMMSRLSSGMPTKGELSGLHPTVGNPSTLATSSIAPTARASASSSVSERFSL